MQRRKALQAVSFAIGSPDPPDAPPGNSDFLTMANVFASWRRASDSPSFVKTFCERNFISHQVGRLKLPVLPRLTCMMQTLQQIEELRQQLLA
jgi:ATP-dependent RNA helicase DHX29